MASPDIEKAGDCNQSLVVTESGREKSTDSSLPLSGSLSASSNIDGTFKSSLSSNITVSSSVKSSFSGKVSDTMGKDAKTAEIKAVDSLKNERIDCIESRKSCMSIASSSMSERTESICSRFSTLLNKPHKGSDPQWEAIQSIKSRVGELGLSNFRLLKRLGCGDIGNVYLAELRGTRCFFAMKVMDKSSLESRKKFVRAQTEREILSSLDHPFLPTLYTHFETDKFSCLVMEFCSGGDLHTLRQRQHGKHFSESAARFYAAEVLLAIEYLHLLGIVYRDLKPENVLVRGNGHIMLLDFDLSLRCIVSPTVVKSASSSVDPFQMAPAYCVQPSCTEPACVTPVCARPPPCIQPSCFVPRFIPKLSKKSRKLKNEIGNHYQSKEIPELNAEPTGARSMSFVGTHEYLAPEIVRMEGHGNAVDWWTFGIFLYELLFGKTPFKGASDRETLFNVVGQPLRFPDAPTVSFAARDLIRGLLVKDPQHRLACKRGAVEIRQHPFFECTNWALIRDTHPPELPKPLNLDFLLGEKAVRSSHAEKIKATDSDSSGSYVDFDFF